MISQVRPSSQNSAGFLASVLLSLALLVSRWGVEFYTAVYVGCTGPCLRAVCCCVHVLFGGCVLNVGGNVVVMFRAVSRQFRRVDVGVHFGAGSFRVYVGLIK